MAKIRSPRRRFGKFLLWPVIIAALLLLAFLIIGWTSYQQAPKSVTVKKSSGQLTDPYQFSIAQKDTLFSMGYPDAFTILFYEQETANGGVETIRMESWEYYTNGSSLTFINGELSAEDPIVAYSIPAIQPLPYFPEQFAAFMSLDEVVNAAGIESYIEIPLDTELMADGQLYYGPALSFGIKNDQLRYLEVFALSE